MRRALRGLLRDAEMQGGSPEDGECGRAAADVAAIGAGELQAEGALAGSGVTDAVTAVTAIRHGHCVAVQAPDRRLKAVAALLPCVAELVACLHHEQTRESESMTNS